MVDLVSRAPLNARIAGSLERVEFRLESIESSMAGMATKSALEALALRVKSIESSMATQSALETLALRVESLALRVESIESTMAGMATKSDLNVLRAETKAAIESLRADMSRMIWIQSGVLGTLILGLATIMLGLAL